MRAQASIADFFAFQCTLSSGKLRQHYGGPGGYDDVMNVESLRVTGMTSQISAAAVWARWEKIYNSGDVDKFVALYTDDPLLFGSTAKLYAGSEGVHTYFIGLPNGIKAKMGHQQTVAAGPNVLLTSGFADFILKDRA
jgi:hypothetical protein